MSVETCSFRIGAIEALVIADESRPIAADSFNGIFNGAEAQTMREVFARLETPHFGRNILYLKTPTHQILIDTGQGSHAGGQLMAGLEVAGIHPDQIDLLIITHFHLDHIGGICDADGKPIFARARLVVARQEWGHWMREEFLATLPEERRQILHQTFDPYVEIARIDMVDDGHEIVPGIQAVAIPGHTPGQMGLSITSGEITLLHIADVVHFPIQGQFTHCVPRFDFEPEQAIATRRAIFNQAANNRSMIMAYHFPFPGLGYMTRVGDGFDWQPLPDQG